MRQQLQALIDAVHPALEALDSTDNLQMCQEIAAALAEAEAAIRADKIDNADEREQQVVMRPGCNAVIWTVVNGERLTNRRLPLRDDLVCAQHQQLSLAVLAWFTNENEAVAAHADFHKNYVAPLLAVPGAEFQVTGEQVYDWLIEWRLTKKLETQS